MKNLKTFILAIALIAGITGAFATKAAHAPNPKLVTYTWTRIAGEPIEDEQDPFVGEIPAAENNFGCSGSNGDCALGTPASGPTVKLQFN